MAQKAKLDVYIFHSGNCRQAMTFYKTVFGGELEITPQNSSAKVLHSHLKGGMLDILGSDGTSAQPKVSSQGTATLCVTRSNEKEIREAFKKLSEGGTVSQHISMMPWGELFGRLTDKFGIDWTFTGDQHA